MIYKDFLVFFVIYHGWSTVLVLWQMTKRNVKMKKSIGRSVSVFFNIVFMVVEMGGMDTYLGKFPKFGNILNESSRWIFIRVVSIFYMLL